jgi:hypothetical protein
MVEILLKLLHRVANQRLRRWLCELGEEYSDNLVREFKLRRRKEGTSRIHYRDEVISVVLVFG